MQYSVHYQLVSSTDLDYVDADGYSIFGDTLTFYKNAPQSSSHKFVAGYSLRKVIKWTDVTP